jgi:hypothetical protein
MLGFARKFRTAPRATADWMNDLRAGGRVFGQGDNGGLIPAFENASGRPSFERGLFVFKMLSYQLTARSNVNERVSRRFHKR